MGWYNKNMSKKKDDGLIKFTADVHQVKTLVDGGIMVSLSLPENATEAAHKLMDCQRAKVILEVVIMPREP
jgi:hypothetical protein